MLACACGLACDLEERAPDVLQIVTPADETSVRDRNDMDPLTPGLQIVVEVIGAADGHSIALEWLRGGAPQPFATALVEEGVARFPSVTLPRDVNRLQARDQTNGRRSAPITVYYESRCGSISFVEPAPPPPQAELLVLGPADDLDGSPCGDTFSMRFLAATGLPDGSRVSLIAADLIIATGTTQGGLLVLDPVLLGPVLARVGSESFELALNLGDFECPDFAFPTPVRVDCQGPARCEVSSPSEGQLLTSNDDADPETPGLQRDVTVSTTNEALGQTVTLIVNGNVGEPLTTTTGADDAPRAVFPGVSFPEGAVRIDALCEDGFGNVTMGTRRNVSVDSLGCTITITSPAPETTIFVPSVDGGVPVPEVELTATIAGGDCDRVYTSVADDAMCSGLFDTQGSALSVGQTTITEALPLTELGESTLCIGVVDLEGNRTSASIGVVLEASGP